MVETDKRKIAAFVMDVEDWYHLDYVNRNKVDCSLSVLDGVDNYADLLINNGVGNATFSVVGDIAGQLKDNLQRLHSAGFEIACHDWDHIRPVEKSAEVFREHTINVRNSIEDIIGDEVIGYRAPSYGIDREKIDILVDLGFRYDASKINFSAHKLYGQIDMSGFQLLSDNIWRKDNFYEFGVGTVSIAGMSIPVAGGGYIRVFPWMLMSRLIKIYLKGHNFYLFYIHPYEMTSRPLPDLHSGIKLSTRVKYRLGEQKAAWRITKLIKMLKDKKYCFMSLKQCVNYFDSLKSHD